MPTTPKPTAARQQRRRHRGRRCVSGRNRAWVGPRGQKESMLSLDRLHARQRPRGSPNPVSRAKTGLLTGKCKRLRNPTRARATTVWRRSNVSAPGQSFIAGRVRCRRRHAPGVVPGTAAGLAGMPAVRRASEPGSRIGTFKVRMREQGLERTAGACGGPLPGAGRRQSHGGLNEKSTSSEELMLPSGGSDRRRSGDLSIFSRTLYQLSYRA